MQGCTCPANGGANHKFKPMMVESVPPTEALIEAVGINNGLELDADEITQLILAITTRRYLIVCEGCGVSAGGFRGKVEEENSVASTEG